jgi:hypothetical protein
MASTDDGAGFGTDGDAAGAILARGWRRTSGPATPPGLRQDRGFDPMMSTFRPSAILVRHAAAMRAQHATHKQPTLGCPDCLDRANGRSLSIRYSPARA